MALYGGLCCSHLKRAFLLGEVGCLILPTEMPEHQRRALQLPPASRRLPLVAGDGAPVMRPQQPSNQRRTATACSLL